MVSKLPLLAAILWFAVLGPPFCSALPGRNRDNEAKLTSRIEHETNPGKKARLQIRLARLKLTQAAEAYNHNDFDKGLALLKEYRQQINVSWKTLEGSKRGVAKHFQAYKKLEIALREDARLLEDLRMRVPYPESQAIEYIAKESSRIHSQVLGVLFPAGKPPQKSKERGRSSGLLAATSVAEV